MEKPKRSKRKSELFSVSFKPEDLAELQALLDRQENETGNALSRNELIRRAMLAHVQFMEDSKDGANPLYLEVFKKTK